MNPTKLGDRAPERILILRALQLGDLMCAIPAFRALRSAFPGAMITLLGLPWSRSLVDRFSYYLDDFIEFPGFPGLPEREAQVKRIPGFFEEMQWLEFDLVLQMQGNGSVTNPLVELFGAWKTAGFYQPGGYCPDPDLFLPYPEGEHEIRRHLRLMEFLGIPLQGEEVEFPIYPADWESFSELRSRFPIQKDHYAVIHVGARAVERRWPVERFAEVAEGLAQRGLQVILTGVQDELELARGVQERANAPLLNLAGQTSLGSLAALLSGAVCLVCNDTGVSHLAAALLTPSVVLFSDSEPERWAPLNRCLHRVVSGAREASSEMVLAQVQDLLSEETAYAS
jgi:ADP-heptose:LPS heptosyltransferase